MQKIQDTHQWLNSVYSTKDKHKVKQKKKKKK